ncbi:MAG: hypothetical protein KC736_04105 [Candidatus Moranbacteria bacterium]|nr:hypothetical protein [Candidatus Moranbacteria bacterium]
MENIESSIFIPPKTVGGGEKSEKEGADGKSPEALLERSSQVIARIDEAISQLETVNDDDVVEVISQLEELKRRARDIEDQAQTVLGKVV